MAVQSNISSSKKVSDDKSVIELAEKDFKSDEIVVDGKIVHLKRKIKAWKDSDSRKLDDELTDLRDLISYIHTAMELELDWIIVWSLLRKELFINAKSKEDWLDIFVEFSLSLAPILNKLTFESKLKVCYEKNGIDGSLQGSILNHTNKYRNEMSHLASGWGFDIDKYKNNRNYLEVLDNSSNELEQLKNARQKFADQIRATFNS